MNAKIRNLSVMLSVVTITAALSSTSVAGRECGGEAESFKLRIRVVQDRPVEVLHKGKNADEFHVCLGDAIEWQLQGSEKRFYLNFLAGAPFAGNSKPESHNGKITVTVDNAESGDVFDYDTGIVDGEAMDPRIIVD